MAAYFNESQISIISDIVKTASNTSTSKLIFTNLLEILHCECDVDKCKESKRFQHSVVYECDNEEREYIMLNNRVYKFDHCATEADKDIAKVFIKKMESSTTILDCLIGGTKDEKVIAYITDNYENIISKFKDLAIAKEIVEYTGTSSSNQFKTKTGFIDIRCASSSPSPKDDVIVINLKELSLSKPSNEVVEEDNRYVYYATYKPASLVLSTMLKKYQANKPFYICIDDKYEMLRDIQKRRVMITHNDLDGIGCAILAIFNNQDFEYIYSCGYSHMTEAFAESLSPYDEVICTDISFKPELRKPNMKFFDHHESAGFSNEHCGTWLYYQSFEKTKAQDRFVHLVDVFDCWRSDNPDFQEACNLQKIFLEITQEYKPMKLNLLQKSVFKYFMNIMMLKLKKNTFKLFPKDIDIILSCDRRIANRKKDIPTTVSTDKNGYKYMIFTYVENIDASFISHYLINELHLDWIAIDYGKSCSLRSRSVDLSKLMTVSGHKHACSVKRDELDKYIR